MSNDHRHDSDAYAMPPNPSTRPPEDFEKAMELQKTSGQTSAPPSVPSPSISSQSSSSATVLHHSRMDLPLSAAEIPLPKSPVERSLTASPLSLTSSSQLRRPTSFESVLTIRARQTPDRTYRAPRIPGRFYQPMSPFSDTESHVSESIASTLQSNPCYSPAYSSQPGDGSEEVSNADANAPYIPSIYEYNLRGQPVALSAITGSSISHPSHVSPVPTSISTSLLAAPNVDVYSVNQAAPVSLQTVDLGDVNFLQDFEYRPMVPPSYHDTLEERENPSRNIPGSTKNGEIVEIRYGSWRSRFWKCVRRVLSCGRVD